MLNRSLGIPTSASPMMSFLKQENGGRSDCSENVRFQSTEGCSDVHKCYIYRKYTISSPYATTLDNARIYESIIGLIIFKIVNVDPFLLS